MKTNLTKSLKSAKNTCLAFAIVTLAAAPSFASELTSKDLNRLIDDSAGEAQLAASNISENLQLASLDMTRIKTQGTLIDLDTEAE